MIDKTIVTDYSHKMNTVSKGKLKAKMLDYFRRVERTGEELIVTDHNVPVLRVVPIKRRQHPDELFADVRGKAKLDARALFAADDWGLP